MPREDQVWITTYPGTQDDLEINQPDLYNDSSPGVLDGHRALVEHVHSLRDKLDAVCLKVGDDSDLPAECILDKLTTHLGATNPHSITKSDVSLGNVANLKVNLTETRDPNSGDNAYDGYEPGSLWVNITDDKAFICTHDEIGNGKWAQVGAIAAHALGGAEHTADTLANLNAKISDATLDDSSASRTPSGTASGNLSGTYPSPTVTSLTVSGPQSLDLDVIADGQFFKRSSTDVVGVGYGDASDTVCQGNDSRLPTTDEKAALAGTGTPNATNKYVTSDDTNQLPTTGEKDALVGTNGTPGSGNPYVTDSDTRNTNARTPTAHASLHEDGQTDEITVQNLGSGAAPASKVLETDGTGGWNLIDTPSGGAGGQTDTVSGSNGITNTGDNVDAVLTPTYGTSANTICQGNDGRLPSTDEKAALAGTSGTPSDSNRYVTNADSRNTDSRAPTGSASGDLGGTYPSPSVAKITVSGPTALTIGAVTEGQYLKRGAGDTLIGDTPGGGSSTLEGLTDTPSGYGSTGQVLKTNGSDAFTYDTLDSSDVGLGNVTNDAQLKRSGNDWSGFTEKASPVGADILLLEDSAASYAKKYVQVTNLPSGGGTSLDYSGDPADTLRGDATWKPASFESLETIDFIDPLNNSNIHSSWTEVSGLGTIVEDSNKLALSGSAITWWGTDAPLVYTTPKPYNYVAKVYVEVVSGDQDTYANLVIYKLGDQTTKARFFLKYTGSVYQIIWNQTSDNIVESDFGQAYAWLAIVKNGNSLIFYYSNNDFNNEPELEDMSYVTIQNSTTPYDGSVVSLAGVKGVNATAWEVNFKKFSLKYETVSTRLRGYVGQGVDFHDTLNDSDIHDNWTVDITDVTGDDPTITEDSAKLSIAYVGGQEVGWWASRNFSSPNINKSIEAQDFFAKVYISNITTTDNHGGGIIVYLDGDKTKFHRWALRRISGEYKFDSSYNSGDQDSTVIAGQGELWLGIIRRGTSFMYAYSLNALDNEPTIDDMIIARTVDYAFNYTNSRICLFGMNFDPSNVAFDIRFQKLSLVYDSINLYQDVSYLVEELFTTDGTETPDSEITFNLNKTPGGHGLASTLSGYHLFVYRNGNKLGYTGTLADRLHYKYNPSANTIGVWASGEEEEFEIEMLEAASGTIEEQGYTVEDTFSDSSIHSRWTVVESENASVSEGSDGLVISSISGTNSEGLVKMDLPNSMENRNWIAQVHITIDTIAATEGAYSALRIGGKGGGVSKIFQLQNATNPTRQIGINDSSAAYIGLNTSTDGLWLRFRRFGDEVRMDYYEGDHTVDVDGEGYWHEWDNAKTYYVVPKSTTYNYPIRYEELVLLAGHWNTYPAFQFTFRKFKLRIF